ncbi:unnamed protein product [Gongylonema pulchrum]|uniref:MFS domain-containing protein n=1 Tax=Gongylonema pulchrum TaxID=637853 RepID=A0A183DGX6_9BILA|nr:unnamed protein product [Gongylonema pulchrum]
MSCLVAYIQLSPTVTMPLSGALCQSRLGWPMVFYVHGVLSLLLFIIYGFFYRNNPSKHPMVSTAEMRKISAGKSTLKYVLHASFRTIRCVEYDKKGTQFIILKVKTSTTFTPSKM